MSECAKCNGWGVDDVTGFACPSCRTVKQSLTVELVSNPDALGAAMTTEADLENPASPKSKLTFLEEAARDIALMHENIREGYMPEQSQAVIDAYRAALAGDKA